MFGGIGYKIGILAKKGPGADVTPDPLNNQSVFSETTNTVQSDAQTITGINTAITLYIDYFYDVPGSIFYIKNGISTLITDSARGDNFTISISNNDTLAFRIEGGSSIGTVNFDIYNLSDNNNYLYYVVLDFNLPV